MDFYSLLPFGLSRSLRARKKRQQGQTVEHPLRRPMVEPLEDRMLLSSSTISGFVYRDANNNGRFDAGEVAVAGSDLELRNKAGQVVATATTNAQGFYEFSSDATLPTEVTTLEHKVSIPSTLAGFSIDKTVQQFDPQLGQLLEVEIINNGSITSEIRAENNSTHAAAKITGTVSGSITLSGPGFSLTSTQEKNAGSFNATAFDGNVDFGGTSGKSLPATTAEFQSKSTKLTGSALNAFIGKGTVTLTEKVEVDSTATGGGNLLVGITSMAQANFTVRYKYAPSNALRPGDYTIIQKTQPAGLLDGLESRNGVVLPGSVGADSIPVTLADSNLTNNNFGEVSPASLSGFVFNDKNGNGIKNSDDPGIAGANITLSGTNDLGQSISRSATTGADGKFAFNNLRPGTYTLTEQQPQTFLDGKDTAGNLGGTAGQDKIEGIKVNPGSNGTGYNFAEVKGSSIGGFVYHDKDNDGVKDAGEPGISGVSVVLSGTDDKGPVTLATTTAADGSYKFTDLRGGTYTISEAQPQGYLNGKKTPGSLGTAAPPATTIGAASTTSSSDEITGIALGFGQDGTNYNFGEIKASSLAGTVFNDTDNDGVRDSGETGIANVKITLTGTDDLGAVNRTATTGADGKYKFDNLRPGTYSIQETQPADYLDGKQSSGTAGGTAANDRFNNIALSQDTAGTGYDFGELVASSLAGRVYHDANENGKWDDNEAGVGGVKIDLTGTDDSGAVTRTVTTAADGTFKFAGLRPGTYSIQETQPAGYTDAAESVGSLGGDVTNDKFSNIELSQGEQGVNYNFGELGPADLGVVKTGPSSSVLAGGTVQYTIKVTNTGPGAAKEVRLEDKLPAGMTFVSAISPDWTVDVTGSTLVFLKNSLAAGQSSTITVTATAPLNAGSYTNNVVVSSATPDLNPANNSSSAKVTVAAVISPEPPPILPPADPGREVLTKSLILSSSDFWYRMLKASMNQ